MGYFLQDTTCFECHHACKECSGHADNDCVSCNDGYFFEDGRCVEECGKNTEIIDGQCTSTPENGNCKSPCLTCSKSLTWCLSCRPHLLADVVNSVDGTCVDGSVGSCDPGFFVDADTSSCQKCSEKCKECELTSDSCFECWDHFPDTTLDWATYKCTTGCSSNTIYDVVSNTCEVCNPVCLTCSETDPSHCLSCSKTDGGQQLYLQDNECVIECKKPYGEDEDTNTCERSTYDIISPPVMILAVATAAAGGVLLASAIIAAIRRKKIGTLEEAYAYLTLLEFIGRLFLVANLWAAPEIFAFSVCITNMVATGVFGVFFYFLFLEPIFLHSPHFGGIFSLRKKLFSALVITSSIVGVNFIRLVYVKVFGVFSLAGGLGSQLFFVKPLNTIANFTLVLTCFQAILCVVLLIEFNVGDDIWSLAVIGLPFNLGLILFQIVKNFQVHRFVTNGYQGL